MDLCNINQIKSLLDRHGFRFSKSMGQNFLIEPRVPREIAAASGAEAGTAVLEIGPGIGPLTVQLAQLAEKVVAVELDRDLLPILGETLAPYPNVEVVPGDVMELDLAGLVTDRFQGLTPLVCANLPYNITTPVITRLLESRLFAGITVMIQKEAAQRVCAAPGQEGYGVFSVLCQYYSTPEILFQVPPDCFLPAPKVTSAVVRLTPRPQPDFVSDEDFFFRTVRGAFSLRRKTLPNALATAFPLPKEVLAGCVQDVGLSPTVRGEALTIPQFAALAQRLRQEL